MKRADRFSSDEVLKTLTSFQMDTVHHVFERFYGSNPTDRFLVADETGLGKTIVARGLIARVIEELQDANDIDHIDIVYVCSNMDLAKQNLRKLDVLDVKKYDIVDRLTLLATQMQGLSSKNAGAPRKPVNLMSFTPGTSFGTRRASGTAEERALLYLLLKEPLGLSSGRTDIARRILQGGVKTPERFQEQIDDLNNEFQSGIDPILSDVFLERARSYVADKGSGSRNLLQEFDVLMERYDTLDNENDEKWDAAMGLVGPMRRVLARVSIEVLTPDLVILDEFQRFRDLTWRFHGRVCVDGGLG